MKRKPLLDRKTLNSITLFPLDENVVSSIADDGEVIGCRYLMYQCVCRYINEFFLKYGYPQSCGVDNLFLTKKDITAIEGVDIFLEEIEHTGIDWLYDLASYCGWDYIMLTNADLEEEGFSSMETELLVNQIRQNNSLEDYAKAFLEKMVSLLEEALTYDAQDVHILHIRGIKKYLGYREAHPEQIVQKFKKEDKKIQGILENINHIFVGNTGTDCCCDDSEVFLLGWLTGGDGYYYHSIGYLNPNWLLHMYVLHDLIEHAQLEFGYDTGEVRKNDG